MRENEIFIYSIRIEPSIFDFSVEILCKLYNIGSGEDSGVGNGATESDDRSGEIAKWQTPKFKH